MSAERARGLLPGFSEGLAGTTGRDLGPCSDAARDCAEPVCGQRRETMSVFIVPAGGSLPVSAACAPGRDRAAVAERATMALNSSAPAGEWAVGLPSGLYGLFFAPPEAPCARCAGVSSDSCWVDVQRERITLRTLTW